MRILIATALGVIGGGGIVLALDWHPLFALLAFPALVFCVWLVLDFIY